MGDVVMTGDFGRLAGFAAGLKEARRFNAKVAAHALPLFEQNFLRLAGTNRNAFGVRGGFWNRMLSGTKAMATTEAAIIRMPREVRLRHRGGTVRPKVAKYLAIPQAAEAYGKSPRQFDDLRIIRVGNALLAVRHAAFPGRRDAVRTVGTVLYVLVRSATIQPRADVLPADSAVDAAALAGARAFVRETLRETNR